MSLLVGALLGVLIFLFLREIFKFVLLGAVLLLIAYGVGSCLDSANGGPERRYEQNLTEKKFDYQLIRFELRPSTIHDSVFVLKNDSDRTLENLYLDCTFTYNGEGRTYSTDYYPRKIPPGFTDQIVLKNQPMLPPFGEVRITGCIPKFRLVS